MATNEKAGADNTGSIQIEIDKPFFWKSLQASLDSILTRAGVVVRGCSLHEKDKQRWIALPSILLGSHLYTTG